MKNIIYLFDAKKYEFDTVEELKKEMFPNAQKMSENDLVDFLYEKMLGFSVGNNFQIVKSSVGVLDDEKKPTDEQIDYSRAIVIDNLDTYLVSLCKFNVVVIFEEINHRYYTKNVSLMPNEEKYAIVNAHANEILKALVGDKND